MSFLSRRQLATYTARTLAAGDAEAITKLAAYLVDTGRTREAELLAGDVEKQLYVNGILVAHVVSAHELDTAERTHIEKLLRVRYGDVSIQLDTRIDTTALGGVVVQAAGEEFDGSLRRSINRLKAMKA